MRINLFTRKILTIVFVLPLLPPRFEPFVDHYHVRDFFFWGIRQDFMGCFERNLDITDTAALIEPILEKHISLGGARGKWMRHGTKNMRSPAQMNESWHMPARSVYLGCSPESCKLVLEKHMTVCHVCRAWKLQMSHSSGHKWKRLGTLMYECHESLECHWIHWAGSSFTGSLFSFHTGNALCWMSMWCVVISSHTSMSNGVATISRLLEIIGLFLQKSPIKETIFCTRDL